MSNAPQLWHARHGGVWLDGASIISATTEEEARSLLLAEMAANGIGDEPIYEIKQIDMSTPKCVVIWNGDY
jgi:hypothetical protein